MLYTALLWGFLFVVPPRVPAVEPSFVDSAGKIISTSRHFPCSSAVSNCFPSCARSDNKFFSISVFCLAAVSNNFRLDFSSSKSLCSST